MNINPEYSFWSNEPETVLGQLKTSISGLTDEEALLRKEAFIKPRSPFITGLLAFLKQYKNPLAILLLLALAFSSILGEYKESSVIFGMLLISSFLSFIQERKANKAAEKLRSLLKLKARVKRNNKSLEVPIENVVPGDIVILEAGDVVPCDGLILRMQDFYVSESVLTGESVPAEKNICVLPGNTSLNNRKNSVFKGTHIISGTATIVSVFTGKESLLGKMETELMSAPEETAFEKGIKNFGYMLMRMAFLIAGIILIANIWVGKSPLDSVLFALALSIGLTPELLPAIITITLSAGAKRLADKKVIVKKLASIQNLGAIDVLCSDKTGTLTEGEVKVYSFISVHNIPDLRIKEFAYLNAYFESGYPNPMDEAIRQQLKCDVSQYEKFDEVPYDFVRKRLSIVVGHNNQHMMITKGALKNILEVCTRVQTNETETEPITVYHQKIKSLFEEYSAKGFRVIGISYKNVIGDPVINKNDEIEMVFLGFLLLYDPPKSDIIKIIQELKGKKIDLKIITGDNTLIAQSIAAQLGIPANRIISGTELHSLNDDAIASKVDAIDVFSETEPSQKELIVRALQKKGHVVGYLGDGINDASALRSADVGISVNNAVDVAKEAADIILTEKELSVISEGVSEGRKTYLNTLKYIFITISANFGNMISMAIGSIIFPFLPLLPPQILLTNFLTDIPALTIASDNVDSELLEKPRRWNIKDIRRFMIVFGLESSLFDLLSFWVLIGIFHASPEIFRTGWFMESVITEILILLIIRTRRPFFRSQAGKPLLISSIAIIIISFAIPFFPSTASLGLIPVSFTLIAAIATISILYAFFGEVTKAALFKKINY